MAGTLPSHGREPERRVTGKVGRGPDPWLLPRPWGSEEKERAGGGAWRTPGARGPTRRQEVPYVHCPGDGREPRRRQRLGRRWGPGAGSLVPRDRGPFASHLLPEGEEAPSRAALLSGPRSFLSSAVRRGWRAVLPGEDPPPPVVSPSHPSSTPRPVRPGPGTSGCPLAGLASTCPGGRTGLGVRRSLLHRPAPALPCFLFNNIAREAPAESTRQNFLPGWGCGCERQSPVSWLPVPSGTGQRPRSRDATPFPCASRDPGPHLAVSCRWRQQGQDGGTRGKEASSPTFCQISFPVLYSIPLPTMPGLDLCRGGRLPPQSVLRVSSGQLPGAALKIHTLSLHLSFLSYKLGTVRHHRIVEIK